MKKAKQKESVKEERKKYLEREDVMVTHTSSGPIWRW
jgi:hypothetical protein